MSTIIHYVFYQPIFNLLMFFYSILGNNLGWSIIAIAALAKLATIPMTRKQMKSAEQMKDFQSETKKVKEMYGKNKEKMNEELAKLSTKYMPAQLGGCLPMILSIVLLFQIRAVVINLVNRGYHAFNEVSYSQTFNRQEDSVSFDPGGDLATGIYEIRIDAKSSNGKEMSRVYKFEIVDDTTKRIEEIKTSELARSYEERQAERDSDAEAFRVIRESEISVFNPLFDDVKSGVVQDVVLSKFLFFTREAKTVFLVDKKHPTFEFYLRPPSNSTISDVKVYFAGEDVSEKSKIVKGESLNLNFAGIDLSKVGAEYTSNIYSFLPYLVLAVLLGATQFVVSKFQMGMNAPAVEKQKEVEDKKGKKKKNKKKNEPVEELSFADAMQESSRQMIYFMPIFSILLSLGVIGASSTGAHIFPSAVSLFWTAQNGFVIIQLAVTKREELKKQIDEIRAKLQSKFNKS